MKREPALAFKQYYDELIETKKPLIQEAKVYLYNLAYQSKFPHGQDILDEGFDYALQIMGNGDFSIEESLRQEFSNTIEAARWLSRTRRNKGLAEKLLNDVCKAKWTAEKSG